MTRALSVSDLLSKKYDTLGFQDEWFEAFGTPEAVGTWIIYGNSANGKTSFTLQLCKELARFGRVIYDSLEQGGSKSMQDAFRMARMQDVKRRLVLVQEKIDTLSERLARPKSPQFVVIDSLQYTGMNYKSYIALKEKHRDKLIILVSHASGKEPLGRAAQQIKYDVDMKIWVEGFKAFSQGRSIGSKGNFVIWDEEAKKYWGVQ